MSEINWNLADPSATGRAALTGFEMGQRMKQRADAARDEREMRAALAAYNANPDDANALNAIMERNPELAMKLTEFRNEREYRGALSEYIGSIGALGGSTPATPQTPAPQPALGSAAPPARNAMLNVGQQSPQPAPAAPGAAFGEAFAPYAANAQPVNALAALGGAPASRSAPVAANVAPQAEAPGEAKAAPDLSFLGEPRTARDRAFLKMVQLDPLKAIKIQSELRDNFIGRVKAEREFYTIAVEELAAMRDDAGWQRAIQRLLPMARELGVNLPEEVPSTYPGPEAVRELLESALPAKEQIDLFLRESNIEADNERADRNTDSLIADREGRRAEYGRHNRASEGNTRRGQDLTDTRQRERPAGRSGGGGGNRSRPASSLPLARTPADALKLPKGTRFRTPDGQIKVRP